MSMSHVSCAHTWSVFMPSTLRYNIKPGQLEVFLIIHGLEYFPSCVSFLAFHTENKNSLMGQFVQVYNLFGQLHTT